MPVKPIPDGYTTPTPYLCVDNAEDAIEFYKKVFEAEEIMRLDSPGGKIGHAELKFGDGVIMLADEHPEEGFLSPKTIGGTAVSNMVYVEQVDTTVERAVENGAKILQPIENKFYGDRSAKIEDPFGHVWMISTHIEDVSPEEMAERMKKFFEE